MPIKGIKPTRFPENLYKQTLKSLTIGACKHTGGKEYLLPPTGEVIKCLNGLGQPTIVTRRIKQKPPEMTIPVRFEKRRTFTGQRQRLRDSRRISIPVIFVIFARFSLAQIYTLVRHYGAILPNFGVSLEEDRPPFQGPIS